MLSLPRYLLNVISPSLSPQCYLLIVIRSAYFVQSLHFVHSSISICSIFNIPRSIFNIPRSVFILSTTIFLLTQKTTYAMRSAENLSLFPAKSNVTRVFHPHPSIPFLPVKGFKLLFLYSYKVFLHSAIIFPLTLSFCYFCYLN